MGRDTAVNYLFIGGRIIQPEAMTPDGDDIVVGMVNAGKPVA